MAQGNPDDDILPVMNPVQIVVLNLLATLLLVGVLRVVGVSWGTSLLIGWLGGAVITLGVAVAFVSIVSRVRRRVSQSKKKASSIWMWDEDAADDKWASLQTHHEQARRERDAADQQEPSRRKLR